MEAKDALGNPIVFGSNYGYSQSSNGFSSVTIGEAVRVTEKGMVTLKPISKKRALYNHEPEDQPIGKSVTVKPMILFPVNI